MPWGHPSLFHAATHFLNWYKMVCRANVLHRLIWVKFMCMLSMYVQSGTQAFSLKNYCGFNTKSYCSDACGYHWRPQTLAYVETWVFVALSEQWPLCGVHVNGALAGWETSARPLINASENLARRVEFCILGRELGPSGVSRNQCSRWKHAFSPLKHV